MKLFALFVVAAVGCEVPTTTVVVDNAYAPSSELVIYQAFWQAVRFSTPLAPGASSDPQNTVPASANTAYVVLAPDFDPSNPAPPTAFVVLESSSGFAVDLDSNLEIAVDDSSFVGNCETGSQLDQAEADLITQRVFDDVFAGLVYDAATCTTSSVP